MLDDAQFIAQKDPQDLLPLVADSPRQLLHQFTIEGALLQAHEIDNIVVAGMGGSALAAETLKVWPEVCMPLVVCRSYGLPPFVNERTLVIVSSFSGNTEEALSALDDAKARGAKVVIVANGGTLKARAKAEDLPFVQLPDCVQPRVAALYSLKAFATILENAGIISGALSELENVGNALINVGKAWTSDVPTVDNPAKRLAEEIMGKTSIIYGGVLYGVAYKWKISFNENAKNLAWCGQLPEFNHNEFIGWSSHPIDKPFAVINLMSNFDHERVQKRFIISDKLLSGHRPESIDVQAQGATLLEQIIWADVFGSMITVYVALLNGVNPTPVDLVEKFKIEMNVD